MKYRLIVRGVYEFQVYASEYWAGYLLDEAGSSDSFRPDSQLYHLVTQLSSRLEELVSDHHDPDNPLEVESDPRLYHIQRYPLIVKHVQRSLQARSLEHLEKSLKQQEGQRILVL